MVRVGGAEARGFLQGLVTGNVVTLEPGEARWAALLTPQGKILFDFLMTAEPEAILLDVTRGQDSRTDQAPHHVPAARKNRNRRTKAKTSA